MFDLNWVYGLLDCAELHTMLAFVALKCLPGGTRART
jgi:hypothetical protein